MEDYPRTWAEFEVRFSTEEACREYLWQLRWPKGIVCPRCPGTKTWPHGEVLRRGSVCDYQRSVTAGTVFQDTHKPLTMWFRAMWYITSQKNGGSALGMQRVLGLKSYQTAWAWLHKLRRAMVRPGRERLIGWVEVDETYLGGLEEGVPGRQPGDKALIVVAAQAAGNRIGRIRLRAIPDASAESLHPFVRDCVEPGSTVHTDGWKAGKLLPRVHLVVSRLKRWLVGTHQGAVSRTHLPYYWDEFTFRFNRRRSRSRGKLFFRLVEQAVATDPTPYSSMIHRELTSAPSKTF